MSALKVQTLFVAIATAAACGGGEGRSAQVRGDVAQELAALDTTDMPEVARAFLASDRPWRATQVMRAYLRGRAEAAPDHRVLAARAEAGWGAWEEAGALLAGVDALETYDDAIGVYLLGRARDEAGDAAGAVEAYRAFLAAAPAGAWSDERGAARLRLGLALIRSGDAATAGGELARVAADAGAAAMWFDLLRADALAGAGDTAAVRRAVSQHTDGMAGLLGWRARVEAARRTGDPAAARVMANRARAWASTRATQAEFLLAAGRHAAEMGDSAAGRDAFRTVIAWSNAAGAYARAAAEELRRGPMNAEDHLAVARVQRAQGLNDAALDGYRRWLDAGAGTAAQRTAVQLEYATALFYAQRYDDAAAALRPITAEPDARLLLARTEARRGNDDEAAAIYLAVADADAGTARGAQALFLAASVRHDAGDERRAAELYRRMIQRYPGVTYMGLSMMRLAGMLYEQGEYRDAARIWDEYRTRYPRGGSVLQAMYWAARARQRAGDVAGAASLFRQVRERERGSYYALLASEHLRVPFWPVPMSAAPGEDPAAVRRVEAWLDPLDLLRAAGFPEHASAEADRLVDEAGRDRPTLYALAEALAERGYSRRAIRIGLRLQGSGTPDARLLRILYPFPFRTLVTEEARARDLDPFVVAALIRQESMFEPRVTSPAGARGLMQIMPPTGSALADAAGLDDWDSELLFHPELNVHLGTRYLAEQMAEYDGSLPSVFAAYNAGPHRVEMWSSFPEYGDDELFTERIPFAETRGYVRILTRNLAIYRGLYGADDRD
jgi:soluble lytic murein transglycosylase